MKQLKIPFLSSLNTDFSLDHIDLQLNKLPPQSLDYLLWSEGSYKPEVCFRIGHNNTCIFLKFTVMEDHLRMVYNQINDPVYKDSCVEFFIGIENDSNYYNLEFNCAGTCSVGYGSNKFDRKELPSDIIANIATQTKLWRLNGDFSYCWEITLMIPVTIFIHHPDVNLNGLDCRVNFFKCGDDLPQPHFLAWNKVGSEKPNFHLSEFFGKALFLAEQETLLPN
ncbi:carbohydrate-binding family 9-like protein [Mucilaginibacter arboris]|nr:carbohydrate-binding family 9-like protein [Mucilaginibacter arboris]